MVHSHDHDHDSTPASPTAPTKRIISRAHLQSFLDSPTHQDLVDFLEELNESVVGYKLTEEVGESEVSLLLLCYWRAGCLNADCPRAKAVRSLLEVLREVEQTVKDTPPVDNGKSRFGNPAFKTFYDRIAEVRCSFILSLNAQGELELTVLDRAEGKEATRVHPWSTARPYRRAVDVLLRELGKPDSS